VIGAVAAGAGVLRVHGLDQPAREVVGRGDTRKIGGQESRRSRLGASTASEHLCARTAGLPGEGIESDKVILVDAEQNHSRFLLSLASRFDCGTALRVTSDGQR
jgi:hypothetical protein